MRFPEREDYLLFLDSFASYLSTELPNVCFFVYGSSLNNGSHSNRDFNYGRSDIDGGLIFDSGVVIPKDKLMKLSELFQRALNDKGIQTQFNLIDLETCRDGRFLSYTTDYTNWIKESARVYSGPNLLAELNGKDFKSGVLHSAAFNFCGPRGVRNNLLYSLVQADEDKEDFKKKVVGSIEKVAKFPKKIVWLRKGIVLPSRFEARKALECILDEVDLTTIDEINKLLCDPREMYSKLDNIPEAIRLLSSSLTCMEEIVASYIKHFPEISERELRQ